MISIYAGLPGMRASDCPQSTIPPFLLITPYRPDLVIFNKSNNSVAMLELTCPLDSVQNLESAMKHKQGERNTKKYSLSLIDWEFAVFYSTIELAKCIRSLPITFFVIPSKLY